ncbi:uncharacterized protein BYT42DRAFT_545054 [Radiomyces spectabilis]|uniref:uncharacterized protein n=1 Tax=Radiomyces spectabilis TaxID=64574 RepID=UPI002220F699|nr:uncharacterized protein BYT42DRAFT_545054 [Radiomyces spectabilis]KAI8381105.1 hypothetical protein BYT42DRAFT_545054 [Radiomyces spectabilis]
MFQLDAVALYEMFGSKDAQLVLYDEDNVAILTVQDATKHKDAVLGSSFDMARVQHLCGDHGLDFHSRMAATPSGVARVLGYVREGRHGPSSRYEDRQKFKSKSDAETHVDDFEEKIEKAGKYIQLLKTSHPNISRRQKEADNAFEDGKKKNVDYLHLKEFLSRTGDRFL